MKTRGALCRLQRIILLCTHVRVDWFLNRTNLFGVVVSHPPSNVFRVVSSFQNSSPDARQPWIIFGFDEIVEARKLRILKSSQVL